MHGVLVAGVETTVVEVAALPVRYRRILLAYSAQKLLVEAILEWC
jgi:hypothetical protein